MNAVVVANPASNSEASSNPLTIAHIIARLNVGGAAVQAILTADALRSLGYRSLLLTGEVAANETSMDYLAESKGISPIHIATLGRRISPLRDFRALCRLVRILWRERPTVVHTHTAKAGALGRVAAMLARVPVRVHTFHGHVFHGYFSPSKTRFFLAVERFLARHTDRIIAVSESQRRELVEVYKIAPADKIVAVRYGFDFTAFLTAARKSTDGLRERLSCPHAAPIVGWIGRLTHIKRPELFVDAADFLRVRYPDIRCVVAGEGELRETIGAHIQRTGLEDYVSLLGAVRDLPPFYADLDLVAVTSRNEGTPVVLLEAMAAGKPFVATDVGGIRDLMVGQSRRENGMDIFENGILTGDDPKSLADAIDFLLRSANLRHSMGAVGRQFVIKHYSVTRLADDLEQLYSHVAGSKLLVPLARVDSGRSAG